MRRLRHRQQAHPFHLDAELPQRGVPRGRARDDAHAPGESAPSLGLLTLTGVSQMMGVGCIPWSPLCRGFLARPWKTEDTIRAKSDASVVSPLPSQTDHARIIADTLRGTSTNPMNACRRSTSALRNSPRRRDVRWRRSRSLGL